MIESRIIRIVLQQELVENIEAVTLVLGLAFLYWLPQIWQYSEETLCRALPARGVVTVASVHVFCKREAFPAFFSGFRPLVFAPIFSI